MVKVDVGRSGAGSVTLTVSLPRGTAAEIEDLQAGLRTADLRQAGWSVATRSRGPGGAAVITASHPFSQLSQVPLLVADIAGSGPEDQRPFRLAVVEDRSFLTDRYVASGSVDLRCGLSCFADPRLAASVGYALGLPPAEVSRLFGPHPARELTFHFEVLLPGKLISANAAKKAGAGHRAPLLIWAPTLGSASTVQASSQVLRTAALQWLLAALGAGALLVLATLTYLLWRRHRAG